VEVFLVGGAVRDALLGIPVKERDYLVVGSTPEEMLKLNFRPVGKDFPVFIHPESREEYALARTERKTGPGYHGFEFHASREVSLEEDLKRRDLTINAIAQGSDGQITDPYGGRSDLEARLLRHISPAFCEDPVRILRVARFLARFKNRGFSVHPETQALMRDMVEAGEIDALVPERVFQEFNKALGEPAPEAFLQLLREIGALERLFPEFDALFGVPQDPASHPEIDTGDHVMMVLAQAVRLTADPRIRFAALAHDLGKARTPRSVWPHHPNHEALGIEPLVMMGRRLRFPEAFTRLGKKVILYHGLAHRALSLSAENLLALIEGLDGFRQPEEVDAFLIACKADARGRLGSEESPYPQSEYLALALDAARSVSAASLLEQGLRGPALGHALRNARLKAIAKVRADRVD
jgi:tRNA nucleotidyltransferase (CCA-adding enzyme)